MGELVNLRNRALRLLEIIRKEDETLEEVRSASQRSNASEVNAQFGGDVWKTSRGMSAVGVTAMFAVTDSYHHDPESMQTNRPFHCILPHSRSRRCIVWLAGTKLPDAS